MRPPICAICRKRFSRQKDKAGLVYFQLTDEEKERKESMKKKRIVGHPPGVEWFCEDHYQSAKSFGHLSRKEALRNMKRNKSKPGNIKAETTSFLQRIKRIFGI